MQPKRLVEAKLGPTDIMDQDVHIRMPFRYVKALVALLGPQTADGLPGTLPEGSMERVYLENLRGTDHAGWVYRIYVALHNIVQQGGGFKN